MTFLNHLFSNANKILKDLYPRILKHLSSRDRVVASGLNKTILKENEDYRRQKIIINIASVVRNNTNRERVPMLKNFLLETCVNMKVSDLGMRKHKIMRFGKGIWQKMRTGQCIVKGCETKTDMLYCTNHESRTCLMCNNSAYQDQVYCNEHKSECIKKGCTKRCRSNMCKKHESLGKCVDCGKKCSLSMNYCVDHSRECGFYQCKNRCKLRTRPKYVRNGNYKLQSLPSYCSEHIYHCRKRICSTRLSENKWCDEHFPPKCFSCNNHAKYFYIPSRYHSPIHENIEDGYCLKCLPRKWKPIILDRPSFTRYVHDYEKNKDNGYSC